MTAIKSLSKISIPMPAAALLWFSFGEIYDFVTGKPRSGTGPSYSAAMDFAALVLLLIFGAILQAAVARPLINKLAKQNRSVIAYAASGFLLGAAIILLPIMILRPPPSEFSFFGIAMLTLIIPIPLTLLFGLAGWIERTTVDQSTEPSPSSNKNANGVP
jgi:hypothetical protein